MSNIAKESKSLITRELIDATTLLIANAENKRNKAAQLLVEAAQDMERVVKMRECDSNGTHQFKTVPGSGRFGDRFQERCENCGWIHDV